MWKKAGFGIIMASLLLTGCSMNNHETPMESDARFENTKSYEKHPTKESDQNDYNRIEDRATDLDVVPKNPQKK